MRVIRELVDHSPHHPAASRARAAFSTRPEMSHTTFTVPHMNEPPRRHDITIRVAKEAGRHTDPAAFTAAASQAAANRNASILSAHTARKSSASSPSPRSPCRKRSPWRWPSWPTRSAPGIRSCHPAGKRAVPAVVRGLIERRLPQLIMAGRTDDHRVAHAPTACRGFPGRRADARLQLTCALPGHSW